jgi:hypothetical protein
MLYVVEEGDEEGESCVVRPHNDHDSEICLTTVALQNSLLGIFPESRDLFLGLNFLMLYDMEEGDEGVYWVVRSHNDYDSKYI